MWKHRDPHNDEYEVIRHCETCCEEIRTDYEYYKDSNGNLFCSDKCSKEFYGIEHIYTM